MAFSVIQFQVTDKFREFSKIRGNKFLLARNGKTFIEADSPLALTQEFSKKLCLPQPVIAKRHSVLSFS